MILAEHYSYFKRSIIVCRQYSEMLMQSNMISKNRLCIATSYKYGDIRHGCRVESEICCVTVHQQYIIEIIHSRF